MAEKRKAPSAQSIQKIKAFVIKAIKKNDPQTLERILKAGYPTEEPIQAFMKQSTLMFAASVGQPEIIDLLYLNGCKLDARDICGRTALHYCCRAGNIQNLTSLVIKMEDRTMFEARSNGGITPLMSAVQSANVYMVGKCLNHGFNPFALDCTGKSCMDYATPFKDINGENLCRLIHSA